MLTIQQMREKRDENARALRNLVDKASDWNDEHQKEYDKYVAEIDALDASISRAQKVLDVDAAASHRVADRADRQGTSADEAHNDIDQEKDIFNAYLRGGVDNLSDDQRQYVQNRIRNAMSTGVGSEGGYTVPREFAATLLEAIKSFGGMRDVATAIQTANGAGMDWPTTDATSEEGEIVGENANVTDQDAPFGTKALGAFKYSSKGIAIPFELLQDTAIDLERHIFERLAGRISRVSNKHFTIGTGSGQPEGVVTAAAVGKTGLTGQTTNILFDDLVDLEHSVDQAYRTLAKYMMHDKTVAVLKKKKDADGRPLWLPSIAGVAPATLNGYQYVVNQHMAEMAANAKSVAFGDFSKYIIRDVIQILLFRFTDSAYTRKGQVGFLAMSRHDGKLMDVGGAVKIYQNSAT